MALNIILHILRSKGLAHGGPWGLTADGLQEGAKIFQRSNCEVLIAAIQNNLPTDAIDNIMANTSKFASETKWAGRGVIFVGSGISIYQGYDAYKKGDMIGAHKAGLDLGVGLGTAWGRLWFDLGTNYGPSKWYGNDNTRWFK